ncbi:hypothetical protein ATANTOWER_027021, partial [Ataeniobius toweri]|nr:hypothetical protein [Ataeniobius toweri]
TNYCALFGQKGPSGGPGEGGPSQWAVVDTRAGQTADRNSELSDPNGAVSLHCSD